VTNWLGELSARGVTVLIGDPGRSYLARDRLTSVVSYQVPVTRTLEDVDIKETGVWAFR
jgi:predicted nicotinamide N-methyase